MTLTRPPSVAEALMKAQNQLPFTVTPNDIVVTNGTGAATVVGSLVTLDFAATGLDANLNYNRCIVFATAHRVPTGGFVCAVAQEVAADGDPVRVRLEGDTLLEIDTGNAAVNTLLMGINAADGAATATTGLLAIARSKQSSTGSKRVYFKGTGICTAA